MTDHYITQVALAKMAGVTKGAITKQLTSGNITTVIYNGKKCIDLQDIAVQEYISNTPAQRKGVRKQVVITPSNHPDEDQPPQEPQSTEKNKLQCKKLERDITKIDIANDKELNTLIPREFVARIFSTLFSIDQNQTLQLSASIGNTIAASVFDDNDPEKVTQVTKILDEELYKIQAHKKRVIQDAFKKLNIEYKLELKKRNQDDG
jgi:hypothetical protein